MTCKRIKRLKDIEFDVIDFIDAEDNEEAEAIAIINNAIRKRTKFGRRTETAEKSGYVIAWSNADRVWYISSARKKKGDVLKLDANEVFVPLSRDKILKVIDKIEPLPLFPYSFEAMFDKK